MWPKALARRLGVEHPILLAPMAGGPGTPALAAAVSEAGGLGALAAGYLGPDAIRLAIEEVRDRTARPFAVNLLAPRIPAPGLGAQLAVVLAEQVPVVSFAWGAPSREEVRALRERGVVVLGTAHTVEEARSLEAMGMDGVVAEGAEAGLLARDLWPGGRARGRDGSAGDGGTEGAAAWFASPLPHGPLGTMVLVPQVVDAVRVPVVAAGGIMDGRGIVAAFALGAAAVQMGTAFLACAESGAHPSQKKALLARRRQEGAAPGEAAEDARLARGFVNRFLVDVERAGAILPYPAAVAREAHAREPTREGRAEAPALWAGQGAPLAVAKGAGELVRDLLEQAGRIVKNLR